MADTELKLSSQVRLVKDFNLRLDLLQHDINEDLEPDLKDAKQDIVQIRETLPDLKDAKQDIVQIRETLRDVKTTITDLKFDVNELKNGFSKKYSDNTIRQMLCSIIPNFVSGC